MNYTVDKEKKWDYENGFYLTCGKENWEVIESL